MALSVPLSLSGCETSADAASGDRAAAPVAPKKEATAATPQPVAEPSAVRAKPLKIVALGDSLTAGYGLQRAESFPSRLQAELEAKDLPVEVINAGVSGDTTKGGLNRIDWVLQDKPDIVIVELGGNDMLRGLSAKKARVNLDAIMKKVSDSGAHIVVAGMQAMRNLGPDYRKEFDSIYPDLAKKYDATLYPFFLKGVALNPKLNQADGIHPTAEGVNIIVEGILPTIEGVVRATLKE